MIADPTKQGKCKKARAYQRIKFQERKEIAGNDLEPELREALGDRAYEELKPIYGI